MMVLPNGLADKVKGDVKVLLMYKCV